MNRRGEIGIRENGFFNKFIECILKFFRIIVFVNFCFFLFLYGLFFGRFFIFLNSIIKDRI